MKKILLVMSIIAVLFLAGCQNNDNVNNNVLQDEANQGQKEVENNAEEKVLDGGYDSNSKTIILNDKSDEVMNPLAYNPNIIGVIEDGNGEVYNVISYEEFGYHPAGEESNIVLIVNKDNKVVYYFEKSNESGITLKSTGERISDLKIENNIISYHELFGENGATTTKNEIEIFGFDEESGVIKKEHRKIPMYDSVTVAGAC